MRGRAMCSLPAFPQQRGDGIHFWRDRGLRRASSRMCLSSAGPTSSRFCIGRVKPSGCASRSTILNDASAGMPAAHGNSVAVGQRPPRLSRRTLQAASIIIAGIESCASSRRTHRSFVRARGRAGALRDTRAQSPPATSRCAINHQLQHDLQLTHRNTRPEISLFCVGKVLLYSALDVFSAAEF